MELSAQDGGHALALELLAFLRDAEGDWKLEARLEALASAATELLETLGGGDSQANTELLRQVESLRGTIGEHLGDGPPSPTQMDALIVALREQYEALAAALREGAVDTPRLRPTNYIRNVFHIVWGLFGAALIVVLSERPWLLMFVAFTFAVAGWAMEISRRRSPTINAKLMHAFRHVSHPHEAREVNSSTWYTSALALLSLTHEPTLMMIGVLVLTFADPAAAVIGRRFGRIALVNGRTLEGSVTFALVGGLASFVGLRFAGGGLLPDYEVGVCLAMAISAGLLGAVAELFSRRIDDNFSIPVTSALAAWVVLLVMTRV